MRPRKFYIFFPPALWKRTRNGTEYGIGSIPLGGYVKIPGMHRPAGGDLEAHAARAVNEAPWLERHVAPAARALDENRYDEARPLLGELRAAVERADLSEPVRAATERGLTDVEDALSTDAYWRAPVSKRVAVIIAGPGVNLLFAIGLLAVVFALGVQTASTVDEVSPGTPAARAGLQPGDRIVEIGGQKVTPVLTEGVGQRLASSDGEPVTVVVDRAGERVEVGPMTPEQIQGRWRIGIVLRVGEQSFGPVESVGYAFRETWAITAATGSAIARLVTGSSRDEISSPVGIVQGSSQALEVDYRIYLRILALISLSLALLNMLPLLPLDGGHIAFSLAEGIRGRAIPKVAYERASVVGLALVLMLFFLGLTNDVNRLNGG
jgi:regulator of sigma E protease